jgi:hypothetical protein
MAPLMAALSSARCRLASERSRDSLAVPSEATPPPPPSPATAVIHSRGILRRRITCSSRPCSTTRAAPCNSPFSWSARCRYRQSRRACRRTTPGRYRIGDCFAELMRASGGQSVQGSHPAQAPRAIRKGHHGVVNAASKSVVVAAERPAVGELCSRRGRNAC